MKKTATVQCWREVAEFLEESDDKAGRALFTKLDAFVGERRGYEEVTITLTDDEWARLEEGIESEALAGEFEDVP